MRRNWWAGLLKKFTVEGGSLKNGRQEKGGGGAVTIAKIGLGYQ